MKRKPKNNIMSHIRCEAIDEYTELVETFTEMKRSRSGNTGFLGAVEGFAKDEIKKFVGIKSEAKDETIKGA